MDLTCLAYEQVCLEPGAQQRDFRSEHLQPRLVRLALLGAQHVADVTPVSLSFTGEQHSVRPVPLGQLVGELLPLMLGSESRRAPRSAGGDVPQLAIGFVT